MVNSITVPKEYKHELRNDSSPEYKMACIRDYVKAHPNEVISGPDWYDLIGSSYPNYLKKLKEQGRLVRLPARDGKKGARYHWKWVDKDYRVQAKPVEISVRSLGFEDWPLGNSEHGLKHLAVEMDQYIDENINVLKAEEVHGILKFRKHIKGRYESVRKQREEALKNKENDDGEEN